jgi:GDPmannose 4,6-dehydratase
VIGIDPRYFRPTEVDSLVGDYSKARSTLGWKPRVGFNQLVEMMTDADLAALQQGKPFSLDPSFEVLRSVLA